jgi:hypothetical protein
MLKHRYGERYGAGLDSLHMKAVRIYHTTRNQVEVKRLLSVDPRIIEDELYLRFQQIRLFYASIFGLAWNLDFEICAHIKQKSSTLRELIWCRTYHGPEQNLTSSHRSRTVASVDQGRFLAAHAQRILKSRSDVCHQLGERL